jgi:hypothetical protein
VIGADQCQKRAERLQLLDRSALVSMFDDEVSFLFVRGLTMFYCSGAMFVCACSVGSAKCLMR